MRRTLAFWALLVALPAAAQVEVHQSVDRTEVGTEDVFRLTVRLVNAPDGAEFRLPSLKDFEVLSRAQSTQMSFQMGGGGAGGFQREQRHTLSLRANRPGSLVIPPAVVVVKGKSYRSEPITVEVKRGRVNEPPPSTGGRRADRNRTFPFPDFPFEGDEEDPFGTPEPQIPRTDSDLFLKSYVDHDEVFVGEQVTLSVWVYSRVDLSSVDSVTMPKLEGFWSESLDSPTQLSPEQQMVGGVPYRAYLLKRFALFPVKAGKVTIEAAEADITTGYLFAGHRVHRKSNAAEVTVKPLPPGAPPGFAAGNVGKWRLSLDLSQTRVALGEPLTVRVNLEGRGNLKGVQVPKLAGPASFRFYEPTTTDKPSSSKGKLAGRRTLEYLVMPSQTGTFALPPLKLVYFDPETGKYDETSTEEVSITVLPGQGGATVSAAGQEPTSEAEKNKLEPTALRPLRVRARFSSATEPLWSRSFFWPVALAPVGLWMGVLGVGLVRNLARRRGAGSDPQRKAKAARMRLAAAERLVRAGSSADFFAEVEKALTGFLEAKLGSPLSGLTREQLARRLSEAGLDAGGRRRILAVFEACDVGRFAPGAADGSERARVVDDAEAAMTAFEQAAQRSAPGDQR